MDRMNREPRRKEGFWCWRDGGAGARVCFTGRGPNLDLTASVTTLAPPGVEPAWARQRHSVVVREAVAGCAGTADALVTRSGALALTVVTADCVPVLLAGGAGELAAIHAGWRGIAGRIVPVAVERLGVPGDVTSWIGPAIGRCCYEVGEEVAAAVVAGLSAGPADRAAAADRVVCGGPTGRPHLDLRAAVEMQLAASGVRRIRHVDYCTRCEARLWSYRRDGCLAGRNIAFIFADPSS